MLFLFFKFFQHNIIKQIIDFLNIKFNIIRVHAAKKSMSRGQAFIAYLNELELDDFQYAYGIKTHFMAENNPENLMSAIGCYRH